jgi:hypothetical protein
MLWRAKVGGLVQRRGGRSRVVEYHILTQVLVVTHGHLPEVAAAAPGKCPCFATAKLYAV